MRDLTSFVFVIVFYHNGVRDVLRFVIRYAYIVFRDVDMMAVNAKVPVFRNGTVSGVLRSNFLG